MLQDVPVHLSQNLNDNDPENSANIKAYNTWAAQHEDIMAKSLFSAGTTWPGVILEMQYYMKVTRRLLLKMHGNLQN